MSKILTKLRIDYLIRERDSFDSRALQYLNCDGAGEYKKADDMRAMSTFLNEWIEDIKGDKK